MKTGGMKKGFKYSPNIKQIWFTDGKNNIQIRYDINIGYSIPEGYRIGRTIKTRSTEGKKFYNDGKINKMFKEGTQPENFKLGMLTADRHGINNPNYKGIKEKQEQQKQEYENKKQTIPRHWYNNGINNIICFEGEQPLNYTLGMSNEYKQKCKGRNTWSKGSKQTQYTIEKRKASMAKRTCEQKILSKEKEFKTKLENGTLGNTISQSEYKCFEYLQNKFPNYIIKNQYFDKERYPHNCDIYIENLDLFIELNLFFTHGTHMPASKEEAINIDKNMPTGWAGVALSDFNKYIEAKNNHLNYLVFYTEDDFYNFFNNCSLNAITKIDIKDSNENVYDIGVKDNNNMILSNGLIVHNCKPYQAFKSALYEDRFEMYPAKRLINQITDLERNINTGKVDHPVNGEKDICDAVCGSMFTASKYAEEFAFDYGENYDAMVKTNSEITNEEQKKRQITIDLEEMLKELSDSKAFKEERAEYVKQEQQNAFNPMANSQFWISQGIVSW